MLFLVGGASRSGKTFIARKILAERRIPYLSLDWLMMGFNDGIPEYGIHPLLWPEEIAEKMKPFLLGMIKCMLVDGLNCVIEGESMRPEFVADLVDKHPGKIRTVFLGYTDITAEDKVELVMNHAGGENDWLTKEPDEFIRDHIGNMILHSKAVRSECVEYGVPYIDTSADFLGAIDAAIERLIGEWREG